MHLRGNAGMVLHVGQEGKIQDHTQSYQQETVHVDLKIHASPTEAHRV
jgi:hypothetical protein